MTHFSEALSAEGVYFQSAAKASPWQIGQVERHGDIWKSMLKRVVWSEQVSGRESMVHATSAINQAKNSLIRRSGFSPAQWVLGRQTRLPADLTDESEVTRLGALSLSLTPTSRFYQKSKLRFAAREAFVKVSCSDALKLRKVKPSRGPFPVGAYVFYYDASDTAPGPECWRGVARVVGHEGSHTVWLSHRGLLIAVSPEHLAFAMDEEVQHWLNVGTETELMDAQPGAGGTGFIDLRALPKPKTTELDTVREGEEQLEIEDKPPGQIQDMSPSAKGDLEYEPSEAPVPEATEQALAPAPAEDMSSGSTSMARMRYESERDAKKHRRDSEFFARKERERKEKRDARLQQLQQQAALTPLPPMETAEFDPELHDYHQASPSKRLPAVSENPETEAQEREAKRLRGDLPPDDADGLFCYHVVEHPQLLKQRARESYANKIDDYLSRNVSLDDFLFAFRRNVFDEHYQAMYDHAMQATPGQSAGKKKGRKEVYLKDLPPEVRNQFLQPGGSDDREWQAWQEKEAVDVLSEAESQLIREKRPDLIIPTRWVRTNKNDGLEKAEFLAKSRLVVQGFKDRSLGFYRRDAPTASALAESVCLAVSAFKGFTMISKDVKNAYFSGKSLDREIYLEQPRGGLRGLKPKQLLKAKKAIYGFSEAARMFWIALKGHLNSDGWEESRLEPALFYLRDGGADGKQLRGILVTHVDDVEGGIDPSYMDIAFARSSKALEYATNHFKEFVFRGREIKQHVDGHIDVSMRNYSLSTRKIHIPNARRAQVESSLTSEEFAEFQSGAGELGWLTRQLRCDLCFENGVIQRSKTDACVGDLIRLRQYLAQARRAADFRLRFWSDVDLEHGVLIHLADSGHANGTPESDDIKRYRSVGGYFLLVANPEILDDKPSRANILAFQSGQTKRVCRSTLAAEASHLAEAVEAGDWCCCLFVGRSVAWKFEPEGLAIGDSPPPEGVRHGRPFGVRLLA